MEEKNNNEWEDLPLETKNEVHWAFVDGYAGHGIDQLERFLRDAGDERKRVEVYKHFIKRWLDIMIHTDDVNEKSSIAENLHNLKDNDPNEELRDYAKAALETYYGTTLE
ncbi:MAG: hypothetical protein R3251_00900 [Candidatus Spechtbacterales bacterium]|nr:hypothetical protein [Candidatus Spechtbacterales bacterium]